MRFSLSFVVLCVFLGANAAAADGKRVTVKGTATIVGNDVAKARELATRSAQRNAIEQVLGALIESDFTAEQKELAKGSATEFTSSVEDRVFAHTQGFIASQKIVSEQREGSTYVVVLDAEVRADSLEHELQQLQGVLEAAGYPRLAVVVTERYAAADRKQITVDHPTAPALIEAGLLERGLVLLARDTIAARRTKGDDLAKLAADETAIAHLALEAGADVAVAGSADATFMSNKEGDGLTYVGVTLTLTATDRAGETVASVSEQGRGVGANETTAREAAVKQVAPKATARLIDALVRSWSQRLARGDVIVKKLGDKVALASTLQTADIPVLPKKSRTMHRLEAGSEAVLLVEGPAVLEIDLVTRAAGANSGTLTVERDRGWVRRWSFAPPKVRRPVKGGAEFLLPPLKRQITVAEGKHRLVLSVHNTSVFFDVTEVRALMKGIAMADEIALPKAQPRVASSPAPAAAEPPLQITATKTVPAPPQAPSAPIATLAKETPITEARPKDGTVGAATGALAEELAASFARLGMSPPFHRVAVPAFKQTADLEGERMGELVAQLLAVDLANHPPFVVVERERMTQLMKEHRLRDLGVVDPAYAAEFGKVLGAQSILLGTVGEAGPEVVVTVRQVDVESGAALGAAKVTFARAGLVALSSDAVEMKSKSGALFRSLVVPGWGQFYNGDVVKGSAFLTAGLGTLGAAGYFLASGMHQKSLYESDRPETIDARNNANQDFRITNGLLIAFAATWVLSALDAYISGRDAQEIVLPKGTEAAR